MSKAQTISVTYDVVPTRSGYQGRIFVDDALVTDFDAGVTPTLRTIEAASYELAEHFAKRLKRLVLSEAA